MSSIPPFRVQLWDIGASRGRGTLRADILDASEIGGSEFANDAGECYFTLPMNHPQIGECQPLQRHYRVSRFDPDVGYIPTFNGILDDFDANADEVVFYGRDYLSLLNSTITQSNTSYTSAFLGNVISDQWTAAQAEADSRLAFISTGSIDSTSTTATLLTSFQGRLDFMRDVALVLAADRTVRPIIQITPRTTATGSFSFNFTENRGSNKANIRLEYGGLVRDFRYLPGYGDLATTIKAVGVKREGASILYSSQSYAAASTYGYIAMPALYQDIVDQAALDARAKREARRSARIGKQVGLQLKVNGLAPFDGYDLGDSLPVKIDRGIVSVDAYYTLWGLQWIGRSDGSEDLFLDLLPKDE